MLELTIPAQELYDGATERFIDVPETHLKLEHSLVSVSKWESITRIPFSKDPEKTREQFGLYIRCMVVENSNPSLDPSLLLNEEQVSEIIKYVGEDQTATTFYEPQQPGSSTGNTTVTSELIYYYMIALEIPFSCEEWNLSRLLTLIRIVRMKTQKQKKMSRAQVVQQQREMNRQRLQGGNG